MSSTEPLPPIARSSGPEILNTRGSAALPVQVDVLSIDNKAFIRLLGLALSRLLGLSPNVSAAPLAPGYEQPGVPVVTMGALLAFMLPSTCKYTCLRTRSDTVVIIGQDQVCTTRSKGFLSNSEPSKVYSYGMRMLTAPIKRFRFERRNTALY